jgi:hypothetical protein
LLKNADAFLAARSPAAGINDRALGIRSTGSGAALALAAHETGQAIDDRLDTDAIDAGIGDTGVVLLLAAAVAVSCTGAGAGAVDTDLIRGAISGARFLGNGGAGIAMKRRDGESSQAGAENASAIAPGSEIAYQAIEFMVLHAQPSPIGGGTAADRETTRRDPREIRASMRKRARPYAGFCKMHRPLAA